LECVKIPEKVRFGERVRVCRDFVNYGFSCKMRVAFLETTMSSGKLENGAISEVERQTGFLSRRLHFFLRLAGRHRSVETYRPFILKY
jgi:hypothetical protein